MNVWKCEKWKDYYSQKNNRRGIRIDCDKEIDEDVRQAIKKFVGWLRKSYLFPVRIRVYVKQGYTVKASDGELVKDLFFWPYDRNEEPYIKTAVGGYKRLLNRIGRDDALSTILFALARQLTHYFQWLNNIELTHIGESRQATSCARLIMNEYKQAVEHP